MQITLGWYIVPILLTVVSWAWFRFSSDSYTDGIAGGVMFLVWLVLDLFIWLVYAACAAIFNIF